MRTKQKFSQNELKMPEESFGRAKAPNMVEHSYSGVIIGLLILVLMAILAGIYLWSRTLLAVPSEPLISTSTRPTAAQNKEPESNNARADAETLQAMSTSDEISAIESD